MLYLAVFGSVANYIYSIFLINVLTIRELLGRKCCFVKVCYAYCCYKSFSNDWPNLAFDNAPEHFFLQSILDEDFRLS